MSDHIEVDGKKYYEESYLVLANSNTKRAKESLKDAVAAEREACAKIAEEHMPDCDGNGCTCIADAIRARGSA